MKPSNSAARTAIYLSPWLGVLLIIALDLVAHNVLLPAEFSPGKGPAPFRELGLDALRAKRDASPIGLVHYAGAVSWIAAAKLHFIVCLGAFIAAWVRLAIFFQLRPKEERRRRRREICIMTMIPVSIFVPFMWFQGNTDMYQLVLQASTSRLLGEADSGYTWALPFIDGLGILVSACLAAVASQLTYPLVQGDAPMEEKTARLAAKMQMLRFLLYVGMVVLTTNIVQVHLFLEQVHGFLLKLPDGEMDGVKALTKSLVAARSVLGTLLLAAIYLPASFFLKEEAYRLTKEVNPSESFAQQNEWLKERELVSSTSEMLPRFAAILAPLLAAPLADFATHLNIG